MAYTERGGGIKCLGKIFIRCIHFVKIIFPHYLFPSHKNEWSLRTRINVPTCCLQQADPIAPAKNGYSVIRF